MNVDWDEINLATRMGPGLKTDNGRTRRID